MAHNCELPIISSSPQLRLHDLSSIFRIKWKWLFRRLRTYIAALFVGHLILMFACNLLPFQSTKASIVKCTSARLTCSNNINNRRKGAEYDSQWPAFDFGDEQKNREFQKQVNKIFIDEQSSSKLRNLREKVVCNHFSWLLFLWIY